MAKWGLQPKRRVTWMPGWESYLFLLSLRSMPIHNFEAKELVLTNLRCYGKPVSRETPNKAFKPLAMLARTLRTPHPLRMPSALLRSRRSAQSAA